ncbi:hypothetical protein COCVIDRAFT_103377, partial [Bipolaris victoriae FI3]
VCGGRWLIYVTRSIPDRRSFARKNWRDDGREAVALRPSLRCFTGTVYIR